MQMVFMAMYINWIILAVGNWGGGMAGVKREKKRGKEDSREAPIFKVQKEEEYLTGTQDLF